MSYPEYKPCLPSVPDPESSASLPAVPSKIAPICSTFFTTSISTAITVGGLLTTVAAGYADESGDSYVDESGTIYGD